MAGINRKDIERQGFDYIEMFDVAIKRKQKDELLEIVKKIEDAKNDDSINAYEKGLLLETLVKKILDSIPCLNIVKNAKSDSNEYDFVVQLNIDGRRDRAEGIIPKFIPDVFLIECKNYKKPVEVGLIGKFLSLVITTNHNLGIFISNIGLSGTGERVWKDANAFLMKANLKYSALSSNFASNTEEKKAIILLDLTVGDLKVMLENDINFFDLLIQRMCKINLGITADFESNIQPHPNQGKIIGN